MKKVSIPLKDFLALNIIQIPYMWKVYVHVWDDEWEDFFTNVVEFEDGSQYLNKEEYLNQFINDYKVVGFEQLVSFGELDGQEVYLVKKDDERWNDCEVK